MKKFMSLILPIVLTIGFMFAVNSCSKEDLFEDEGLAAGLKSAGATASASGHGMFYLSDDMKRQFSFHAKVMPDGTVKGSGVVIYTTGELVTMFDINCMVVDGNTAILGGVLTKVTVAGIVGDGCYFVVEDNGEGKKPGTLGPDRISALFYAPGVGCADAIGNEATILIEGGNIQVNP